MGPCQRIGGVFLYLTVTDICPSTFDRERSNTVLTTPPFHDITPQRIKGVTIPRGPAKKKTEDTGHQSLESKLWATANKLRGHLDAADYKHVVLGLIFLASIA